MEIIVNIKENDALIALKGRLDTTTAPDLDAKLKEVLPTIKNLEFDFTDLEYLSSAGLRVLLSTQKTASANGNKMVIKHVNDTIMDIFDMTGFSSILTIE